MTEPTARGRIAQSAEQRAVEANRIPALWALAEQRSRGSFSAPRTATAIYDELLQVYELGVSAGRKMRDVDTSTAANDATHKLLP